MKSRWSDFANRSPLERIFLEYLPWTAIVADLIWTFASPARESLPNFTYVGWTAMWLLITAIVLRRKKLARHQFSVLLLLNLVASVFGFLLLRQTFLGSSCL